MRRVLCIPALAKIFPWSQPRLLVQKSCRFAKNIRDIFLLRSVICNFGLEEDEWMILNAIALLQKGMLQFWSYRGQWEAKICARAGTWVSALSLASGRCSCHPGETGLETSLLRQRRFQCSNLNHFKEQKSETKHSIVGSKGWIRRPLGAPPLLPLIWSASSILVIPSRSLWIPAASQPGWSLPLRY